jgi:serine/threonine protein kinase
MNETMCGTPYYMAPEIMHNLKYSTTSDLWSVGIIMYEMLYGLYPYGDNISGPFELRDKIDTVTINYPKIEKSPSPFALNLLQNLLQKLPEKRITWDAYFGHFWFNPHHPPKSTSSEIVLHTTAASAPVQPTFVIPNPSTNHHSSVGAFFDMDDDNLPGPGKNTPPNRTAFSAMMSLRENSVLSDFSSSHFLDSQLQSVTPVERPCRPFLQLVDNYRSGTDQMAESSPTMGGRTPKTVLNNARSAPVVIRHPQYEENEDANGRSTFSSQVGDYWNATVRLAKDSLTRSFHGLP